MSANLIVDLGNTAQLAPSLPGAAVVSPSGQICGLSGILIGDIADLLHADTYCNLIVAGTCVVSSGPLRVGVQCSDSTTSGTFTDPTSGLAQLPTTFASGGWLIIGSGGVGDDGPGASGSQVQSGFIVSAAFQRTGEFARVIVGSGQYVGPLQAGFVSQLRTTGSGGGFTYSPGSGVVNV